MPRTWKSALAPLLAGIPERTGFAGEFRFGLLNDIRFGEKKLPRMIDRCGALALPKGAALPAEWPKPELERAGAGGGGLARRAGAADDGRPVVAFAPGAVGPSKRWTVLSPSWPENSPPKAFRSGCWAARPRRRSPPRSSPPPGPARATSPRPTSATPSWR